MILDRDGAIGRVKLTLASALGSGAPLYGGYGEAKARAVAAYAGLIAEAYAAGALGEAEMKRELDEIAHMTRRWIGSIRGLPGSVANRAAEMATEALVASIRADLSLAGSPLPRALDGAGETPLSRLLGLDDEAAPLAA